MKREEYFGNMSILDLTNALVEMEIDLVSRGCTLDDCKVIFGNSDSKKIFRKVEFILGQRKNSEVYELHVLLSK